LNVAAGQESKVIWTGTPLEEIYNGVESLRYGLIYDDGKSTGAIKKGSYFGCD